MSRPVPDAEATSRATAIPHEPATPPVLAHESWERRWGELGVAPAPRDEHARLFECYREPHRAYHTLQHLAECLDLRCRLDAPCDRPAEIDIALWFHDAIYQVRRSDNETRSAEWLERVARDHGVDEAGANRLFQLVIVTRHDAAPRTRDEAVLVDTDLAILGAEPARFDEYDTQVRKEYSYVPRLLYRRKRKQVLEGFLQRRRIYMTDEYFRAFEGQARGNLERAIRMLS